MTNHKLWGWITIGAGASGLLGTIALILMFTISMSPYGLIADYFGVITPILEIPCMIVLRKLVSKERNNWGNIALVMTITGLLLGSISQILFIAGNINFEESVFGYNISTGLLGTGLLLFLLRSIPTSNIPTSYKWFGAAVASALILGVVYMIIFGDMPVNPVSLMGINPIMKLIVAFGAPLSSLGLPLWIFWSGSLMVKGQMGEAFRPMV